MSKWSAKSGGNSHTYVCKHFMLMKKAYEMKIKNEKADPVSFLKEHPFTGGSGTCHFRANAYRLKGKGGSDGKNNWIFGKHTSVLTHSSDCTITGKIKARQLLNNPGFRASVTAATGMGKGKATKKMMCSRTQELGLGGVALVTETMYGARRTVEAEHSEMYFEKFAALPRFVHTLLN